MVGGKRKGKRGRERKRERERERESERDRERERERVFFELENTVDVKVKQMSLYIECEQFGRRDQVYLIFVFYTTADIIPG
jgi:hypothetical protein